MSSIKNQAKDGSSSTRKRLKKPSSTISTEKHPKETSSKGSVKKNPISDSFKKRLKEARKCIELHNNQKAFDILNAILEEDPNDYMTLVLLAKNYEITENYPEAKKKYIKAKNNNTDPDNVLHWKGLMNLYQIMEDCDGFITAFTHIIESFEKVSGKQATIATQVRQSTTFMKVHGNIQQVNDFSLFSNIAKICY